MWRVGLVCLLSACFSPSFAPCAVRCGSGCPTDWTCGGDGFCHAAEGETSCTMPGMPDAPPIDAADPDSAVATDAAPSSDGPCGTELLVNGTFDESTGTGSGKTVPGWRPVSPVLHDSDVALPESSQSPAYFARLGSSSDQVVTLCQPVTVPAGALDLRLTGFHWVTTEEGTSTIEFDKGRIELRRTAGTEVPFEITNLDKALAWSSFSKTITPAPAGETFDLCVVSDNDSDLVTTFRFDTLSLLAELCH